MQNIKLKKLKTHFTTIRFQRYKLKLLYSVILLTSFVLSIQTAEAQESIIVPNTFTPNNDGINDEFKVDLNGNTAVSYNMSIFANWGILMFNTGNSNVSWDGRTTSGLKATEGTYFYIVDFNGKQFKGTLSLFY